MHPVALCSLLQRCARNPPSLPGPGPGRLHPSWIYGGNTQQLCDTAMISCAAVLGCRCATTNAHHPTHRSMGIFSRVLAGAVENCTREHQRSGRVVGCSVGSVLCTIAVACICPSFCCLMLKAALAVVCKPAHKVMIAEQKQATPMYMSVRRPHCICACTHGCGSSTCNLLYDQIALSATW